MSTDRRRPRTIRARRTQDPATDISLDSVAIANGGFFTRAQALDCGWNDRELRVALRMRLVTRLRQGAYAFTAPYEALDEVGRHVVLARAVVHQQRGRVALTGISAAAAHGLTLWGQDLSTVHVVRLDRGSARSEQVVLVDRVPVVNVCLPPGQSESRVGG